MLTARAIITRLLGLAWPVALARLGIMAMGLVDAIVVGQLAPHELPHQALGWAPTAIFLVASIGLLTGVQVLAARALGEGKPEHAGGALRRGLSLAVMAGVVAGVCMWTAGARIYELVGIAPRLAQPAARVMRVLAFSVPLHLLYIAGAFFLEAVQKPMASTWVMWSANLVNLALNLWLVPKLGAVGSAWATVGARGFLALALLAFVFTMDDAEHYGLRKKGQGPSYRALLAVGVAAAVSQAAEAGAFSGMTLIAGRIGEQAVAAYQIVLNLLAVVFMVALGLSTATAVLASEAVGRKARGEAGRVSFLGLGLSSALMLALGLLILLFRHAIGRAYTADPTLAERVAELLPWAALIILPDGGQVVVASALRAQGDNWFPTGSHLLAYAALMPVLGFWLAERSAQGVAGLLNAVLIASLLSVGVLALRLFAPQRRGRLDEAREGAA